MERTRNDKGVFKRQFSNEIKDLVRERYREGISIIKISESTGVSKSHVWRLCNDIVRNKAKVAIRETGMRNDYVIQGDVTKIYLNRADGTTIETLVDTADLKRLLSFSVRWYANYSRKTKTFYVHAEKKENGKKTSYQLHRWITNCPKNMVVDHINFNPLDNRNSNLRIMTDAENKGHVNPDRVGKNGVIWMPRFKKWKVELTKINLGYHETRELAEEALRKEIEKKYGKPAS